MLSAFYINKFIIMYKIYLYVLGHIVFFSVHCRYYRCITVMYL